MTLEELEAYVLATGATVSQLQSSVSNLDSKFQIGGIVFQLEKENAVLKGRVDGLEARVGELENQIGIAKKNRSALFIIDVYDFNTKTVKKVIKTCKGPSGNNGVPFKRLAGEDVALFTSSFESIALEDNNETGFFRTLNLKDTGDASVTGKELIIGGSHYNGKYYNNVGVFPTEKGSLFIVNRQKLL